MGFAYRLLVRASLNPLINLSFLALLVAGVAFAARSGPILLLGTLLLPWIFFALLLLSLPFVGAAVRWFRIPEATRRNHALEHGTIALLRQQYGARMGSASEGPSARATSPRRFALCWSGSGPERPGWS
jgi:hypothetical protein